MTRSYVEVLERVMLRGIEGQISDRFMEIIVTQEWGDVNKADEAMRDNFEARHMAEAVYCHWRGLDK